MQSYWPMYLHKIQASVEPRGGLRERHSNRIEIYKLFSILPESRPHHDAGCCARLPLRERYPDTWIERIFTTELADARELRLGCRVGDRKPYLPTVFGRHSTTTRGRGTRGRREEREKADRPAKNWRSSPSTFSTTASTYSRPRADLCPHRHVTFSRTKRPYRDSYLPILHFHRDEDLDSSVSATAIN